MVLTDTGLAKVFQRIKSFVLAQLNSKASAIHTHTKSEITDFPTNYVTTDTTQTIGGVKTFSNNICTLGQQIIIKNNNVERTVLPASTVYMSFAFSDKDSVGVASRFSAVENVILPNGDINLDLRAYDFSSKTNAKTTVVLERKYDGTSNFYPEQNNTVNLGTSTNKWSKVYSDDVVHTTGDETIGGIKTFSNEVTMFGRDINLMSRTHYGKNSNPSVSTWQYLYFRGNTATEGYTNAWYGGYIEQYIDTTGAARGRWLVRDTSENAVSIELWVNGNDKQVRPTQNNGVDLGSSTNKWKTFNGVNPGALSLPGAFVNVDTTNWVLDGSNVNIFTPASDGWLGIQAIDTVYDQMHYVFIGRNDSASYHSQNVLSPINALWSGSYHGCVFIPVIKNVRYDIRCICSSITATFYPCQGNV